MKILWLVDKQFDVATDRTTWVEIIRLLQLKHDVYLVTGYKNNKIIIPEFKKDIIYISIPKLPFIKRIVFYWKQKKIFGKLLKRIKPDIIVLNTLNFPLVREAGLIQRKYGFKSYLDIRTLPTYSSGFINRLESFLLKKSLQIAAKYFAGVTYITRVMQDYCQREYKLPSHKKAVWTSGVNVNLFKPVTIYQEDHTFKLLYHGAISIRRQLDCVIRALSFLSDFNIELILLGPGDDIESLKKLSIELNINQHVHFLSIVDYIKVPSIINKADVGILPFRECPVWNTSAPIKLFEYLACGIPVVVTKIPAHINVLQGKDFAFWAKSSDPVAIAKAIRTAYEAKARFEVLGKKAREFVCDNYSWEIQAKKLNKFISS